MKRNCRAENYQQRRARHAGSSFTADQKRQDQQALMILTLLISSKGTAGVARASLLIVFGAAISFHLPMEPLFLLFAIDQLMDMGRTAVTVLGNCVACVVIARWEGEFPAKPATSS